MIQELAIVTGRKEVAEGIFVLRFESSYISKNVRPGQFVNIRVTDGLSPLLRRPFSICRVEENQVEFVFNVVGVGTRILASKQPGDKLDVLGPLGNPFRYEEGFDTAIMVAGGLGIAPFPFLTQLIGGKNVETFYGVASAAKLWSEHLRNVHVATDDGSAGFQGTVVALLRAYLEETKLRNAKIFGCGPTKMLQALSNFAKMSEIQCEVSLEGEMACGVGICQGCPVERAKGNKKYALVCTDGPTFNCQDIVLAA
ncbi:MAG: dihydroorotate dehydrogenase electron transfer subunit [Ignavibacteriales bacterium]|nr:dihydroorotate dehydrogenase electron transfer subunit [Ignavibacteriales bacterium]